MNNDTVKPPCCSLLLLDKPMSTCQLFAFLQMGWPWHLQGGRTALHAMQQKSKASVGLCCPLRYRRRSPRGGNRSRANRSGRTVLSESPGGTMPTVKPEVPTVVAPSACSDPLGLLHLFATAHAPRCMHLLT